MHEGNSPELYVVRATHIRGVAGLVAPLLFHLFSRLAVMSSEEEGDELNTASKKRIWHREEATCSK